MKAPQNASKGAVFGQFCTLNLPAMCTTESCIKKKLTLIFILTLFCGASKGFVKAFKAFIKPSEVPKRSFKIKILS